MRVIWEFIKEHLKIFIGATAGLLVGILMLTLGFWPTLLLSLTTATGALLTYAGETANFCARG